MSGLSLGTSAADQTLLVEYPQRLRDNLGKTEISESQNLFEADFEYGTQPMRWENYTVGGATIAQVSSSGGVAMTVTSASGDLAVRQTRPYIRYQPDILTIAITTATSGGQSLVGASVIGQEAMS